MAAKVAWDQDFSKELGELRAVLVVCMMQIVPRSGRPCSSRVGRLASESGSLCLVPVAAGGNR